MSNTRSNLTPSIDMLEDAESLTAVLTKALYSHQTWSSFVGSFSSSIGSMILSIILNYFTSSAEVSRQEEIARKKIADAFNEAMICLEKTFHFGDALTFLVMAKKQFDTTFLKQLRTNDYYQQIYINIIYALALSRVYLGDIDNALADIKKCKILFPEIAFRKHDIDNLMGLIYLKKQKYLDASIAFSSSLKNLPNQQIIIHLRLQCYMKDSNIFSSELKMDDIICYLSNSSLFQAATIDPYVFEANIAHIEALIKSYSYKLAFERLNAIENQYRFITLSTRDQIILYELILTVLNKLRDSAPTDDELKEKLDESNFEFPLSQISAFMPQKEKSLTNENIIKLENLYKIKLLVLEDSIVNIIRVKKHIKIKDNIKLNNSVLDEKKSSNINGNGVVNNPLSSNYYRFFQTVVVGAVVFEMANKVMNGKR